MNRLNPVVAETSAPVKLVRKTSRTRKPQAKPVQGDGLGWYALAYIATAALLSAVLNGMANARHAPEGFTLMAWCLGAVIPAFVLLLGRQAGILWNRGQRGLAYTVGGIGTVVLLLSVFHCYDSIMVLTGSPWWVAVALAIGIDAGMVASEVVATVAEK